MLSGDEHYGDDVTSPQLGREGLPSRLPADDSTPTSDNAPAAESPFTRRGGPTRHAGTMGKGEAEKLKRQRLNRWAGIFKQVAAEVDRAQKSDYSSWNQQGMYDRIPADTSDEDFAVKVHDWFMRMFDTFPVYKYRAHEWTVRVRAKMAALAHGKRVRNNQTIDEAIKAVLDFLAAENDLGNTNRAIELFDAELEQVREDNKMGLIPGGDAAVTTKPIASAPAAKTSEWYEDKALSAIFFKRDYIPFCTAVGIGDPEAFRREVMGTEHARDSKFKSWTELFTACVRTYLDEAPWDWPKVSSEVTAFWAVLGSDKRVAAKAAMKKRFNTDDLAMIEMEMGRQDFQALITAIMKEPVTEDPQQDAKTDEFFAKANGEPAIMSIIRKMYADAGLEMDFRRATGFDDAQHAGASGALDSQIIDWCAADIARQKPLTADDWKCWLNTQECFIEEAVKALEITRFSEWKGTLAEAEDKLRAYRKAMKNRSQENMGKEASETSPASIPIPEAPVTPPTPQIASVETGTSQPVLGMSEAGFSMNFFWYNAEGEERQFTMREATWQEGLKNVRAFETGLRELGFMSKSEYLTKVKPTVTDVQPAPPSASNAADMATCVLIKVDTSYEGGKAQLQFECMGFDRSLKFTKPVGEMVKLLAGVRKMDGTAFTAEDLQIGKMHPGKWAVKWNQSEKDGKTYRNVLQVSAA